VIFLDTLNKILKLLNESGIQDAEFISKINAKDKNLVLNWRKGITKSYNKYINEIADVFDVPVNYLRGKEPLQKPSKGHWIPVLGEVAAGIPIEAIENIIDYEEITEEMASTGEYFALKIKGDSMSPDLVNGSTVIVRKQKDVECGQIAVVMVDGQNATVKKINKTDKGIMLIPLNSQFETVFYSNEDIEKLPITILGRVRENRREF
jgi:repressor LexA